MRSAGSIVSVTTLSILSLATQGLAFFRVPCPGRVVTERADPIVSPGIVSGHVHTVSGGNGFDFSMTYDQARSSSCSSCPIKADLSNYWTPQLYYQAEDGTFEYVPQSGDGSGSYGGMTVYYLQRGGPDNDNLTAYPKGFRMLAGDPFKRAPTDDFAGQAISFVCLDYSGTSTQTNHLPNKTCPDGLRAQVFFPSCWDGVNIDSSDHKSHMAYPTKYSYDNGPCPASHPVHMISLFYEIIYSTDGFDWWNGTQQPFVFAMGDPYGYGFHGDFLNGWDVDILQNATNRCTNLSGLISDCDVFADDLFTDEESKACIIAPKVNEQVTGTLPALPGCNPVTWGPEEAPYSYATCPNTTISAAKTYYTNVTGWDYLGCGSDDSSARTFNGTSYVDNSLTVESCLATCKRKGFHYAGLEYGDQCYCGNSLAADRAPATGILGNCIEACAGNSTEYCGGTNSLSIYYTANVSATVSCPSGNMTHYTNPNGTAFLVECGMDHSGGDMGMVSTNNGIQGCIDSCGATSGCKAVALSGTACYMKSTVNAARANSGVQAAQLYVPSSSSSLGPSSTLSSSFVSSSGSATGSSAKSTSSSSSSGVSPAVKAATSTQSSTMASTSSSVPLCPNLNATNYTEPITGSKFLIGCGTDHAGGDMGMVYVSNFTQCIFACANTTNCVDVSLNGAACYMKSSLGRPVYTNTVIKGAQLVELGSAAPSSTISVNGQHVAATSTSSSTKTSTSSSKATASSTTSSKVTASSTTTSKSTTSSTLATVTKTSSTVSKSSTSKSTSTSK